jgi:hypothetical protein
MGIIKDESAQTSAEMILIMGGIIVIALVAIIAYQNYIKGLGNEINNTDLQNVTKQISNLSSKFT